MITRSLARILIALPLLGGAQLTGLANAQCNPGLINLASMTPGIYEDLFVADGIAFVANSGGFVAMPPTAGGIFPSALQLLDVSDPTAAALQGQYLTPDDAKGVFALDDLAYVATSFAGLLILDVSDPTNPLLVGSYDTPGNASGVFVANGIAYVADRFQGLQLIDVTNPATPFLLGSYATPGHAVYVTVRDEIAYVADITDGLQVIDVSNPSAPTLLGSHDTPGEAQGLAVSGDVVYLADGTQGLAIIDVANPSAPTLLATLNQPSITRSVAVSRGIAYLALGLQRIAIVDVSNPTTPAIVGRLQNSRPEAVFADGNFVYSVPRQLGSNLTIHEGGPYTAPTFLGSVETTGFPRESVVEGTTAYVATFADGLLVVDVADPLAPTILGSYDVPGSVDYVDVSGGLAFTIHSVQGLQIIDVSIPSAPALVSQLAGPNALFRFSDDIVVSGSLAFLPSGCCGLYIVDVSNPASPVLVSTYAPSGFRPVSIAVAGTTAYVQSNSGLGELHVLDISNPTAPALVASLVTDGTTITLSDDLLFVGPRNGLLRIVDVSDPSAPSIISTFFPSAPATEISQISVEDNRAYVAIPTVSLPNDGVHIIDVADPSQPIWLGFNNALQQPRGVYAREGIVYVSDTGGGFRLLDVSICSGSMSYCGPGAINSTGESGKLVLAGSALTALNELGAFARDLPPNRVGFLIASLGQGFVANPGGSQGNLCLGNDPARFLGQLASSSDDGTTDVSIDLPQVPTNPTQAILAGQTWNFQFWYQDANPLPTSNFTNAVSLGFH